MRPLLLPLRRRRHFHQCGRRATYKYRSRECRRATRRGKEGTAGTTEPLVRCCWYRKSRRRRIWGRQRRQRMRRSFCRQPTAPRKIRKELCRAMMYFHQPLLLRPSLVAVCLDTDCVHRERPCRAAYPLPTGQRRRLLRRRSSL